MGKLKFSPARETDVNTDMMLHEEETGLSGPNEACLDSFL